MSEGIAVHVRAPDPILQAGVSAALRDRPQVVLAGREDAVVVVVVGGRGDGEALRAIAQLHEASRRVVLVVAQLDDAQLLAAVETGVQSILRRGEASGEAIA